MVTESHIQFLIADTDHPCKVRWLSNKQTFIAEWLLNVDLKQLIKLRKLADIATTFLAGIKLALGIYIFYPILTWGLEFISLILACWGRVDIFNIILVEVGGVELSWNIAKYCWIHKININSKLLQNELSNKFIPQIHLSMSWNNLWHRRWQSSSLLLFAHNSFKHLFMKH